MNWDKEEEAATETDGMEGRSTILVSSLLAKVLESAKFGLVSDTDCSKKRRYFRTLPLSSTLKIVNSICFQVIKHLCKSKEYSRSYS